MSILQQYQFWVGFGFVVLLILFLIIAFFKAKDLTNSQYVILRVLCSFCGGFAGALIAGSVLFNMEGTAGDGLKYTITGTAGFALFLVIWFFFPTVTKLTEGNNISVPANTTFKQMVEILVISENEIADYIGFTAEELQAPLQSRKLNAKDTKDSISRLRQITVNDNAIRPYDVEHSNSAYTLKIKS
jgi:hypothetical protein